MINRGVLLDGRGGTLTIQHCVDIAQETIIWTESHDPHSDWHETINKSVTILDHVWIGCRSMIMPGVVIGRGSVVAAGAIVTKDVGDKTIVAGIPAKRIGERKSNLLYTLHYHKIFT